MDLVQAELLVKTLLDSRANSSYAQLQALGEEAVPSLLIALKRVERSGYQNQGLLCGIITTLETIGDQRAVAGLAEFIQDEKVLTDQEQNDPRICAVWALRKLGDPKAIPASIKVLQTADFPPLRCAAALVLGELGDARALPALCWAAENELELLTFGGYEMTIRTAAQEALRQIEERLSSRSNL